MFASAGGQMQVVIQKMAAILEPPCLHDSIRMHLNKQRAAMHAVINTPGLKTKEDLAHHVEALSAVAFIHQAANHKPLDEERCAVYKRSEEKLVIFIKDLPNALTLKDLAPFIDELESNLATRGLLPSDTPKPTFHKTNLRQIADDKRGQGRGGGRGGRGAARGGQGGQRGGNRGRGRDDETGTGAKSEKKSGKLDESRM